MKKLSIVTAEQLKPQRVGIAYQFELESIRLGFTVEKPLTNYRYIVRDNKSGDQYTAMILPTTFDFYTFRLNRGQCRIDLLIVERHNAAVPIRVISLSQVTSYAPLDVPAIEREERKRRNHEESMLLVSKLLLNFESAWAELENMPPRTRQYYLSLREHFF